MVDIHCHLLSGLDDGAQTMEDSLAMARLAAETGTTDIVATPHAHPRYPFDEQQVTRSILELQQALGDSLRVHYGCDFHLTYDNLEDARQHPRRYTVNHGRYLLVEFSDLLIFTNTREIFEGLLAQDIVPVITHPERNPLLRQRIAQLRDWVAMGCVLQVTAQSLWGDFGRSASRTARQLIEERLSQVVASDGHDTRRRPCRLDRAWQWLERSYGEEAASILLRQNPKRVLEGAELEPLPDFPSRPWWPLSLFR
jgi:protein-tyrosine phosphatase